MKKLFNKIVKNEITESEDAYIGLQRITEIVQHVINILTVIGFIVATKIIDPHNNSDLMIIIHYGLSLILWLYFLCIFQFILLKMAQRFSINTHSDVYKWGSGLINLTFSISISFVGSGFIAEFISALSHSVPASPTLMPHESQDFAWAS
jgi:hypothetical protein